MGNLTVTGAQKDVNLVTDADKRITASSDFRALADSLGLSMSAEVLKELLAGVQIDGPNIDAQDLIEQAVNKVPTDVEEGRDLLAKAKKDISSIISAKSQIEAKMARIRNAGGSYESNPEYIKLKQSLALANKIIAESAEAAANLESALNKNAFNSDPGFKAQVKEFLEARNPAAPETAGETTTDTSGAKGATSTTVPDLSAKAGTTDSLFSGDTSTAYDYDPAAITNSALIDSDIESTLDSISDSQKKQKMMALFFYYARMAMTGDMNAMYQFIRFLGFVIGQDKALQNVWMGTKLIELQEKSRQATQELLDTEVDTEDEQSTIDWQKKTQEVKSEEGVIATSQKLITGMMEEFTQISQMLNDLAKSLLDAAKKSTDNLASWR